MENLHSIKLKKFKLQLAGLLAILLLLSSCVQSDQEVYLNPDGSGMADIEVTLTDLDNQIGFVEAGSSGASDTYQQALNKYSNEKRKIQKVNRFIRESKGVDAWENVAYTSSEEELTITARVYFKDITQYQLKEVPMLLPEQFNEEGITFTFDKRPKKKEEQATATVQETVEKVRKEFKQNSPMMAAIGAAFYSKQVFHFPYKIKKNPYFSKQDARTASFQVNFNKMIQEMAEVVENDEKLRNAVEEHGISGTEDAAWEQVLYPKGLGLQFRTALFSGDPVSYVNVGEKLASIQNPQPQLELPKAPTPPVYTQMPEKALAGNTSEKQLAVLGRGSFDVNGPLMVSLEEGMLSLARTDDAAFGKAFELKKPEGMYLHFIRISPDKSRLLVSYMQLPPNPENLLKLISLEDGQVLHSKTIEDKVVNDAVWLNNEKLAMIKGDDLTYATVSDASGLAFTGPATDLEQGREQHTFLAKLGVRHVYEKPLLYCSTGDKLLIINPAEGGGLVDELTIPGEKYRTPVQLLVHDSTKIIATADHHNLYIYYPDKNSWETIDEVSFGTYSRASWNPDGTKLAYLRNGKSLMVLDVEQSNHKELKEFKDKMLSPNELYWSADGKYLLTRSSTWALMELVYP